jgi:transcriptional regulator
MYTPTAFAEDRPAVLHDLIRTHPLGLLITAGSAGLMANPLPFQLVVEPAGAVLRAHLSRGNSQLADLDGAECLVVFQGAQAYVSPSWYATKAETGKVVPTWNYITVQARGRAQRIDDPAWLRAQIEALTGARERGLAEPWTVDDAPADFITAQIKGIGGVEIPITHLDGKWKLSQNRNAADRAGVVEGLKAVGRDDLAALMTAFEP